MLCAFAQTIILSFGRWGRNAMLQFREPTGWRSSHHHQEFWSSFSCDWVSSEICVDINLKVNTFFNFYTIVFVYIKYLNILRTLFQSSKLGLLDFLAALLIANRISGQIQIARYNMFPMALRYFVSLNFMHFNLLFSTGIKFFDGVNLLISYLNNILLIYLI